jgi:molecular chaperone GrpE
VEDKDISVDDLKKDNKNQDNEDELKSEDVVSDENSEVSEAETNADEDLEYDDAENMEEEQENGEVKEKKSFFKKEKKEKKDKKDLKIEELNDRLMRTMAEFDNFRKRTEKEKAQMFEIGARDIIEKILPTIDNFERGLGAITEEEKEGAFAKGIEKIYKQLVTSLEEAGLKPIEAAGKEFDPNFHNAVMHAEDPEQGENLVAEEFQKGYMYRDTVIRHSMVKVVN